MAFSLFGLSGREFRFKSNRLFLLIGGSIYGFFSGLVGSGGPLRGALLSSFGLTGGIYIATNGGISFLTDIVRVTVYLWNGYLSSEYFRNIPLLLIVALIGGFFSKLAVERIKETRFKDFIHIAVMLASLKILLDAITTM